MVGHLTLANSTTITAAGYIIDNFALHQQIDLEIADVSLNSTLNDNEWNKTTINQSEQRNHTNNIELQAQRQVTLQYLPPALFSEIDFYISFIFL